MEFSFNCEQLFNSSDNQGITIIDSSKDRAVGKVTPKMTQIYKIIDEMGEASTKVRLLLVETWFIRLRSFHLRLHLPRNSLRQKAKEFTWWLINTIALASWKLAKGICSSETKLGLSKRSNPFVYLTSTFMNPVKEMELARYSHPLLTFQLLFEKMLEKERIAPPKLGYDKPSEKLLGFLRKHYYLKNYVPQSNNYVVFSAYFDVKMHFLISVH
jgi:hypothetical protein